MNFGESLVKVASNYFHIEEIGYNQDFDDQLFKKLLHDVGWSPGMSWCAAFTKMVYLRTIDLLNQTATNEEKIELGRLRNIAKKFSLNANDTYTISKEAGLQVSDKPVIGALAVFTNISKQGQALGSGHIVIVTSVDGQGYKAIGGNTNDSSDLDTNEAKYVREKYYSYDKLISSSIVRGRAWDFYGISSSRFASQQLRGFILPPEIEVKETYLPSEKIDHTSAGTSDAKGETGAYKYYKYSVTRDIQLVRGVPLSETDKEKFGYLGDKESPILIFNKDFTVDDFLEYKGDTYFANKVRIISQNVQSTDNSVILIKKGTVLLIPFSQSTVKEQKINTNFVKHGNTSVFYNEQFEKLTKDKDYRPIRNRNGAGVSVWIYSRGYDVIFNVSKFVVSIQVSKEKQLGTFNIDFAHFKESDLDYCLNQAVPNDNIVVRSSFRQKLSFFAKFFTHNDIIWIRLEELANENRDKEKFKDRLIVSKKELANHAYDLIGTIDVVSESYQYDTYEGVINVQGRDCSKLFYDDMATFIPLLIMPDSTNYFKLSYSGDISKNLMWNRFQEGSVLQLLNYKSFSIGDLMKIYLDLISNVGYFPLERNEMFFESYGDRRERRDNAVVGGDNNLHNGLYQIVKLHIDESIKDIRVMDDSAASPDGPIMELWNRLCQFPFVELLCDTYYDEYGIVVREPLISKKNINLFLKDAYVYEVNNSQVISSTLSFSSLIFTWFLYEPQQIWKGTAIETSLGISPIIVLNEFVEIWGNQPLKVQCSYVDKLWTEGKQSLQERVFIDLVYIVESHQYCPFMREGTITLVTTDRRIRQGTLIRVNLSGVTEVFYVDSVTYSLNFDNVTFRTTINVSRGLVEKYIDPGEGKISYFNIVDIDKLKKVLTDIFGKEGMNIKGQSEYYENNSFVNKRVFEFFLANKQFE